MNFGIPEIRFISKNKSLIDSFERYYRYNLKPCIKTPYKIIFVNKKTSADEICDENGITILDCLVELSEKEIEFLPNLILIIDLFSLDAEEIKLVKELIITYPEVKFIFVNLFDTNLNTLFFKEFVINEKVKNEPSEEKKNNGKSSENDECKEILFEQLNIDLNIHSFNILSDRNILKEFNLILKGKYNLFDASYIRTALKISKLHSIGFTNNFFNLLVSRKDKLAYSIDEEKKQCLLISYALYKYGFRVLPITSYYEIDNIEQIKANPNKKFIDPNLIVRDWDIQFEDYPESNDPNLDYVNIMRGFFYKEADEVNKNEQAQDKNGLKPGWNFEPQFWQKFERIPIFIFSRLTKNETQNNEPFLIDPKDILWYQKLAEKYKSLSNGKESNQYAKPLLQGITKPLDGLNEIEEILKVIKNNSGTKQNPDELPFDTKPFFRKRKNKNSGHSIPPDIYHIGESLLQRAQKYYDKKMYLLSALLSQESIEIINGLHNDLYLDALYLKHISEVSLETDNLGLSNLKKSANKRLFEIQKEAKRIGENEKAIKDFLSQTFNDIRHLYKEKEQFDAAEEVLKEFITTNHGLNISLTLESLKNSKDKIKQSINNLFKEFFEKLKSLELKSLDRYLIWFYNFGWILLPYFLVVFIIFQVNTNNIQNFPIWFTVFNLIILFFFIIRPKLHLISLVYTLVGRAPSLRFLIISIALSHLFFSIILSNYFNSTKELKKYKSDFEYSIPLNLLYTTFSMQASTDFEKIINPNANKEEYDNSNTLKKINSINQNHVEKNERKGFLILLINHLVLVYSYLGIFISTLYQKLKKE